MAAIHLSTSRTLFSKLLLPRFQSRILQQCIPRRSISRNVPRPSAESSSQVKVTTAAPTTVDRKGKQKETASSAKAAVEDEEDEEDRIPFLQRPLGVRDPPTTEPSTWRDNMMNQETRMAQRRQLVKEATKGYFTDLNATRRHGGKTWIAPRVLIREDKSLYFPDIAGTTLLSNHKAHTTSLCTGKVTIIKMLSSKISEIQTEMLVGPTQQAYASNPHFQIVQINLQENLLKSLLVSLFTSSIRKTIPEAEWGRYLVSSQNMDYLREDLGMANRHVGHIYLVDERCKIRWAGCADPKPEEVEALRTCTGVLLKRHSS